MEVDFRSETSEIIMTFTDRVHLSASTKTGRVECFIDKKLRYTWDDVSLLQVRIDRLKRKQKAEQGGNQP